MGINNVLWYIDEMMKDPHAVVKIHLPNQRIADSGGKTVEELYEAAGGKNMPFQRDVIKCFLTDAVELSTSASYTTIGAALEKTGEAAVKGIDDLAAKAAQAGMGKIGAGLGALASALKLGKAAYDAGKGAFGAGDTVAGSIKAWTGSDSTIPPIPLTFVAINPEDNILQNVMQLTAMCMPGSNMGSGWWNLGEKDPVFWAPNKYSPAKVAAAIFDDEGGEQAVNGLGYGGGIDGTCRLEIGKWFSVGGLIPVSASFSVSTLTTKKGYPLYATGTVTFETYRSLRAREYMDFFRKTDII